MKKMHTCIAWMIFISINLIQLTSLPLYNAIRIFDRPIFTYFLYISYVFSIFSAFILLFRKQRNSFLIINFFLITLYLFYLIYSLLLGASFINIIIESSIYVMMISVYLFADYFSNKHNLLLYFYYITVIILSIISIYSSFGYLSGIGTGDILRSSVDADGNNGVFGLTLGFYGYFYTKNKGVKTLALFAVLSSIIILITGMSRTRIIIGIISLLIMICFTLIRSKGFKNVRKLIFFTLFLSSIGYIFREQVSSFTSLIMNRFMNLNNDFNITYRLDEIIRQIDLWKTSPIIGHGWTGLTSDYLGFRIYDHNSYSSLLVLLGSFGAITYFTWFLIIIILMFRKKKNGNDFLTFFGLLIIFQIVLLGYANMGFAKSSSIIGILFVYILLIKKEGKIYD